jgi:hypothetical protein
MWTTLLVAVGSAMAVFAGGEPSFELADDGEKTESRSGRTVVVKSVEDLALKGISGKGAAKVRQVLERVIEENPETDRVRVFCGTATEGSSRWTFVYPRSLTPLDAEDRPHGTQWLMTNFDPTTGRVISYRLIPWEHGVKDGVEQEFRGAGWSREEFLAAEVPWRKGKMHGERKTFYPDGELKGLTRYVDGLASGPARQWDADGNLLSECPMKDGERHGKKKEYWPGTDQPRRIIPYRDDRVEGLVREFYRSGKLKRERRFHDDMAHGVDRIYDEDGNVISRRYWFEGTTVSREEFEKKKREKSRTRSSG